MRTKQPDPSERILAEIQSLKADLQDLKASAAIDLITIDEAADFLKFSKKHIYELCKTGSFAPVIKIGTSTRFRTADIAQWLAAQTQRQTA
jgi:excisionase family DNA binding protein